MFGSLIERVTRNLVRRGVRDGLLAGNGVWMALGAVAWLIRFLRKRPSPKVVTETLRSGESIVVTNVPAPPFGRRARKIKRADRKSAAIEAGKLSAATREAATAATVGPDHRRSRAPSRGGGSEA